MHAWVADHGLTFATQAAVELMGLTFSDQWDQKRNNWTGICLQYDTGGFQTSIGEPEGQILTALRYAIASANPEEHAAAEAALDKRGKSKTEKELRTYLMPERADWFTEVRKQNYTRSRWWMLPCSARSLEDFRKADESVTASAFLLYTALYVLGPAIAPLLAEELDSDSYHQRTGGRKQALNVLAALPTDEAFTILLDRIDEKHVRPAMVSAMRAFPVRAARLLAERAPASDHVRRLLHIHLRSNPHLTVPDEVAALLAESAEAIMPEATVDQLPALLASPPWLSRKKPVKPVVLADLPVPEGAVELGAGRARAVARVRR